MTTMTKLDKEKMAEENIKLAFWVAEKFRNSGYEYDEIVSAGMFAFAKAIDTFKEEHNVKFSTYAINCIRNEILYFLRTQQKHSNKNISLNYVISVDRNGIELTVEDTVADATVVIDKGVMEESIKSELLQAINTLTERERKVITYSFFNYKTQADMAKEFNISAMRISQIKIRALEKLRKVLNPSLFKEVETF